MFFLQLFDGGVVVIGRFLAQDMLHKVEVIGTLYAISPRIAFSPYPLIHCPLDLLAAKVAKIGE